jgi:hypothetical protein
VTVEVTVTMAVIVVVTIFSTLIFKEGRKGQGNGVVPSFWLVPEKTRSWSFLHFGA